jgi:hypothetical protein
MLVQLTHLMGRGGPNRIMKIPSCCPAGQCCILFEIHQRYGYFSAHPSHHKSCFLFTLLIFSVNQVNHFSVNTCMDCDRSGDIYLIYEVLPPFLNIIRFGS